MIESIQIQGIQFITHHDMAKLCNMVQIQKDELMNEFKSKWRITDNVIFFNNNDNGLYAICCNSIIDDNVKRESILSSTSTTNEIVQDTLPIIIKYNDYCKHYEAEIKKRSQQQK